MLLKMMSRSSNFVAIIGISENQFSGQLSVGWDYQYSIEIAKLIHEHRVIYTQTNTLIHKDTHIHTYIHT